MVAGDGWELFLRPFSRPPPPVLSDLDLLVEDSLLLLAGEGMHSIPPSIEGLLLLKMEIKYSFDIQQKKIEC